ncbi:MAG: bifunctional folylpolyglutamate synthase/dihydrofolate synthase [Candidatus Omnitrophica bacterium]|nr:bifunctional folylpolyglutamate synthase/dihydrofolate synthase [Candidatus Omnitrophota bacterium]MDD5077435.1 bifunctional folylpolyglutamate synthase/dihydrofolate synthase [Candidatus Omnitrophota bacterium]
MTYLEARQYLESLTNYEKDAGCPLFSSLKLRRVRDFLTFIGNPQKYLKVIHVAGTKGKGSVCAMTAYILREAGFSVGLYTSPHLKSFRERIRILKPSSGGKEFRDFEGEISKNELADLVGELKPLIGRYNRRCEYGPLSFFEVYTALAFLYFRRRNTDFTVLETGMGGRLDATNIADSLVCGITPISFEHCRQLGNTLSKIAAQKAGIIKKNGSIVISAPQCAEVRKILLKRSRRFRARLFEVGKNIRYSSSGGKLTVRGLNDNYRGIGLKLRGRHQEANAALAVGLVEGLSFSGFKISSSAIRRGLHKTLWPGRCEVAAKNPLVVLDGAQNKASARAIRKAVADNFKYRKLILVLGISSDKDIRGICGELEPFADEIIVTRASTARAASPAEISGYLRKKNSLTGSVREARRLAFSLAGKQDLVLVTGSLFVVGEFRNV